MRLSTVANQNQGSVIGNDLFQGVPVDTIGALSFATYVEDEIGAGDSVPSLEFNILLGGGTDAATLVFEPANTVSIPLAPEVWQTWDALSAEARWTVEGGPGCDEGCLMSWAEVLAAFPGANIVLLVIRSGIGASDVAGHLDALTINGLTYDFEPDAP